MMRLKKCEVGSMAVNCYLLGNPETGEALIIDPGAGAEKIKQALREENWKPVAILLTHGHFDHVGAVKNLVTEYHIDVYAGEAEREVLSDLHKVLPSPFYEVKKKREQYLIQVDRYVKDGELLELAGMYVTCIATPGHTVGGVSYFLPVETCVFCGDTLFLENVGNTSFPTGDEETLYRSIREKLYMLPDATRVFPGHGPATNIEYEKRYNVFCRETKKSH